MPQESFFNYSPDTSVGFTFMRVYNLWHRQMKTALKPYNITHPQFLVLGSLGYLSSKPHDVTQVAIAQTIDSDVMTVSGILTTLEKYQLITRQPAQSDSRAKAVKLTALGIDILKKAAPIVEVLDARFFGHCHQTCTDIFNQLIDKQQEPTYHE